MFICYDGAMFLIFPTMINYFSTIQLKTLRTLTFVALWRGFLIESSSQESNGETVKWIPEANLGSNYGIQWIYGEEWSFLTKYIFFFVLHSYSRNHISASNSIVTVTQQNLLLPLDRNFLSIQTKPHILQ